VVFEGLFAIGFFDGIGIGVFGDAQNGIVVFGHEFLLDEKARSAVSAIW
jgi:hypothetical protein